MTLSGSSSSFGRWRDITEGIKKKKKANMWWQNDTLTVEVNTNRVHTDFKLETLCQLGPIKMSIQTRKFLSGRIRKQKNLKVSHNYEEKQDKSSNY